MFKKSGNQRRKEIKAARLQKAKRLVVDPYSEEMPKGAVPADRLVLRQVNPFGRIPNFYVDRPFICRDCQSEEVWTSRQQKWWYEIAKGDISSEAVRCRSCRHKENARKSEARRVHFEGIAKKHNK